MPPKYHFTIELCTVIAPSCRSHEWLLASLIFFSGDFPKLSCTLRQVWDCLRLSATCLECARKKASALLGLSKIEAMYRKFAIWLREKCVESTNTILWQHTLNPSSNCFEPMTYTLSHCNIVIIPNNKNPYVYYQWQSVRGDPEHFDILVVSWQFEHFWANNWQSINNSHRTIKLWFNEEK